MKIEAGKKYLDRSGKVAGPMTPTRSIVRYEFPWCDEEQGLTYRSDGTYDEPGSRYDLVSEYVEPPFVFDPRTPIGAAASDALMEAMSAAVNWPHFNSAHEGFAVLLEEVDELWAHVKTNQKKRNLVAMRKEAIQVAAMVLRFAAECCDEQTGRK